jgi:hypothetical protein
MANTTGERYSLTQKIVNTYSLEKNANLQVCHLICLASTDTQGGDFIFSLNKRHNNALGSNHVILYP